MLELLLNADNLVQRSAMLAVPTPIAFTSDSARRKPLGSPMAVFARRDHDRLIAPTCLKSWPYPATLHERSKIRN